MYCILSVAVNKRILLIQNSFIALCKTEDITFDSAPSPQHLNQYEDALIECIVSGQPTPTVLWLYRGRQIQTGKFYTYVVAFS